MKTMIQFMQQLFSKETNPQNQGKNEETNTPVQNDQTPKPHSHETHIWEAYWAFPMMM
jgi:hypothetical protein